MNTTMKYGGYTAAELREFIAHSNVTGESIDAITAEETATAGIISDLLDALASDAAQAASDVRIPMDIAIDARRMRTLRRLLDAMDDMGNGFPGAVHAAFQDGGKSTCRALDEAATPEDLIHAAPVAPAAGAPFDLLAHLARQRQFSERTFGPGARTKGVVDHIRKELCEIEANPSDVTEWIDVVILALDGAWRCGASPDQIVDALVAKQTKNEGRTWPDWRTVPADKAIEHDRSNDAPPASPAPLPSRENDDPQIIAAANRGYAAGLKDGKALGACGPLAAAGLTDEHSERLEALAKHFEVGG